MLHQMRLQPEPFERMKNGDKVLELRIYDEKRRKVGVGDEIEFSSMTNAEEKIRTEVIGLLLYKKFADLIEDLPAAYLGYEEDEKDYLKGSMYEIYTPEEEQQCGVLGIRIRLIK
ncbi:MAG: ASCH domain-containing protein [Candidatus Paceibacterota bacterium]